MGQLELGKKWLDMKLTMVLGNDFLYPYLDDRVYREAATLKEEGWDVRVVCWARTITNKSLDHLPQNAEYKGIKVIRIYQNISPKKSILIKRIIQHRRAMRKMAKKIEETDPDVIHYNDFNTLYSLRFGGKKGNAKALYDSHEDYPLMLKSAVSPFFVKMATRLEKRIVKKYVDAVITVSPPILKRLNEVGPKINELIMNCKILKDYDIPETKVREARNIFTQKLKNRDNIGFEESNNKFILLYIGSLGEDRGLREVISVFQTVKKEDNLILVIGGHGAIENEVKAMVEKIQCAIYIGEVKSELVPLYTKACDAVNMMMNPKEEWHKIAMPNKLFEAMAAKKSIIASADTIYGDVVKKEECGIVIPYGDVKKLKEVITELAENPTLRMKLGKNGFNAAVREYNWEKQGKKLKALYKRLAGDGPKKRNS
ncbi:MAG: glycosyltransferase family 4 protein [Thermoplasmata archaeon]|nr:MAG: glycosyltransferase family 4 protein [Thermoplasmata archaeon]